MKRIVLCADDYGQAPAISTGIIALLNAKRLSATSCMVNSPHWFDHAKWLQPYHSQVDLGLHLNLTEGKPLSPLFAEQIAPQCLPLKRLMRKTCLRKLNQVALMAEIHAQLDAFCAAIGRSPDFIDGHQHVHHFPQVRDALIAVYQSRFASTHKPYIRLVSVSLKSKDYVTQLKKIMIYLMGVAKLRTLLDQYQIPYNHSFSGIYTFRDAKHYSQLFQYFLRHIGDRGLIMCHPGELSEVATNDPIGSIRPHEQRYFLSDAFVQDLAKSGVILSRFNAILPVS